MAVVRLVVGAVIGAAIGMALWVLIQYFIEREWSWLAIGVGILAGAFGRAAAGKARLGYARGAVPAIAALLFIMLSNYALAGLVHATSAMSTAKVTSPRVEAASGSSTDGTEAGKSKIPQMDERDRSGIPAGSQRAAVKQPFSLDSFLWIGIAVLVAYVIGGSGPTETESVEHEPAEMEPEQGTPHADEPAPSIQEDAETDSEA